jgi:hypothetical protein
MTAVLIILAVILVLVIGMSLMGAGPGRVYRRTVVERPTRRRRVVEEPVVRERVVEEPAVRERVVEEEPGRRVD